ncbi:MAG: TonB family protein [Azoarcus sp.]|jgi:protein TonB|nr:TonB family protein [Azoarcus sp.]
MAKKKSFFASFSWQIVAAHSVRVGFAASVLIHAFVLAIKFTLPEAPPVRGSSLKVILVNATSATAPKPKDVQALAQVKSDGGGDTDEKVIASTPLPWQPDNRNGNNLQDTRRGAQPTQRPQTPPRPAEIITGKDSSIAVATAKSSPTPVTPTPSPATDARNAAPAESALVADIAKQLQKYNQRPKRKAIGARTDEDRFAQYVEAWRMKTERNGNKFLLPDVKRDITGLYLMMTVSVRKDGSVEKIEINNSSGYPALDEAAREIVRRSAPYDHFPATINDTDVIDITRTWTFTGRKIQKIE